MLLLWFKGLDPVGGLSHPPAELQCVCVCLCWGGSVCLTPELIYSDFLLDLSSVLSQWTAVYLCMLSHVYNTLWVKCEHQETCRHFFNVVYEDSLVSSRGCFGKTCVLIYVKISLQQEMLDSYIARICTEWWEKLYHFAISLWGVVNSINVWVITIRKAPIDSL